MEVVVQAIPVTLVLSDGPKRILDALLASKTATPEQIAIAEDNYYDALDDGFTISVKRRLNTGEESDLFEMQTLPVDIGTRAQVNRRMVMAAKVLAYLLTWTVINKQGKPIPMSPDLPPEERASALAGIDPEVFALIRDAIDWHIDKIEKEIAAAKKIRGDAHRLSKSSPSPVGVTGDMNGSVN